MALLVEGQQQIDSDLVASLQFETPEARRWGSQNLRDAVIDYVGQLCRGLNVFAGMDYSTMWKRGSLAAVTVAAAAAVVLTFPLHTRVFLARLMFSPDHYPTDTVIEAIEVNGHSVPVSAWERTEIPVGYGQPVVISVRCSGTIPEAGEAQLKSDVSGKKNPLVLERVVPQILEPAVPKEEEEKVLFRGKLERLLDNVTYQLYLGDAWTDPRRLSLIPLPVVQPQLTVTPPEYAAGARGAEAGDTTSLQLSVLESSQIDVEFTSSKPLKQADLTVESGADTFEYKLVPVGDDAQRWRLKEPDTAFARVEQPLRFAVQVTDTNDLQLESPLKGSVRLKADRWPQITGNLVHRVVLPNANPVIELRASDDYGLAELALDVEITRSSEKSGTEATSPQPGTEQRIPVATLLKAIGHNGNGGTTADVETREEAALTFPIRGDLLPVQGGFRFNLAQLGLEKGDRLRITLEATDYRGKLPGRTAQSEPLVLDVSDESGVLAAISEADEMSEARITELIRRQLGIGESP
jgi:hypothetical protein